MELNSLATEIKCIGSGSNGNCYLLTVGNETIILDAGMPIKDIKKALNFDITHVWGCVVTHGHGDHNKSVNDLRLMGLPVFEPYKSGALSQTIQLGSFRVTSFPVPHDGVPCVGFYITNGDLRMVYATDFEYLPIHFKNQELTTMLIECNHVDSLLSDEETKYAHSVLGHASLKVANGIVEANKTDALKHIILCHLSDGWSDEMQMIEEVTTVAGDGVDVRIATAGCVYEIV